MKESKGVEITKIKIKMAHNEIEISIEDARKLKEALDELFGKEVVKEVKHEHHYDWWYTYPQPYYNPYIYISPVTTPPLYPNNPVIWCNASTTTSGSNMLASDSSHILTVTV